MAPISAPVQMGADDANEATALEAGHYRVFGLLNEVAIYYVAEEDVALDVEQVP
jgi:hypothetical protein